MEKVCDLAAVGRIGRADEASDASKKAYDLEFQDSIAIPLYDAMIETQAAVESFYHFPAVHEPTYRALHDAWFAIRTIWEGQALDRYTAEESAPFVLAEDKRILHKQEAKAVSAIIDYCKSSKIPRERARGRIGSMETTPTVSSIIFGALGLRIRGFAQWLTDSLWSRLETIRSQNLPQ